MLRAKPISRQRHAPTARASPPSLRGRPLLVRARPANSPRACGKTRGVAPIATSFRLERPAQPRYQHEALPVRKVESRLRKLPTTKFSPPPTLRSHRAKRRRAASSSPCAPGNQPQGPSAISAVRADLETVLSGDDARQHLANRAIDDHVRKMVVPCRRRVQDNYCRPLAYG